MPSGERRVRSGFTLIEVSVVLALMALVLAVAAVSFRQPYEKAQNQYATEQVIEADRRLRDHARRFERPAAMTVDMRRGVIHATEQTSGQGAPEGHGTMRFASKVDRVLMCRHRIDYGRVVVQFSPTGRTRTYALRVPGAGGTSRWLLFAGETGQVSEWADDKQVRQLFDVLYPDGLDAH